VICNRQITATCKIRLLCRIIFINTWLQPGGPDHRGKNRLNGFFDPFAAGPPRSNAVLMKRVLPTKLACPQLNQRLRSVASGKHNMLCTTRLVAQLIGEEPWLVLCQKPALLPLKLAVISTPKMAGSQMKFG
jgi:hypothetical protein